jgi:hypothetical protein
MYSTSMMKRPESVKSSLTAAMNWCGSSRCVKTLLATMTSALPCF